MYCPNQDGDIHVVSATTEDGLQLDYGECNACHGHWISGFDASYIDINIIRTETTLPGPKLAERLYCPVCHNILTRANAESLPPSVTAYHCLEDHGYFFPVGELAKFKKALSSKLLYHKLWQIPLSSVRSTLLTGVVGLILSAGLIIGVIESQRQQTFTSQAEEILTSSAVYPSSVVKSATFTAQTAEQAIISVVIIGVTPQPVQLESIDGRSHVIRISDLSRGTYEYYFIVTQNGVEIPTEKKRFIMH